MSSHADDPCPHPRAIIGLDAFYCPDCRGSICSGTSAYQRLYGDKTNLQPKLQHDRQRALVQPEQHSERQLELTF
jgi:hypothetical protein